MGGSVDSIGICEKVVRVCEKLLKFVKKWLGKNFQFSFFAPKQGHLAYLKGGERLKIRYNC